MPESFLTGLLGLIGSLGGTILLLLPGLVLSRILVGESRAPQPSPLEQSATAASGGILVHLLFIWWTLPLADRLIEDWDEGVGLPTLRYIEVGGWALLVLVIGPACLAEALRVASDSKKKYPGGAKVRFFARLLRPPAPQDARWSVFRTLVTQEGSTWVRVVLKDGRIIIGPWDSLCVASSDYEKQDMYLARTIPLGTNGEPITTDAVGNAIVPQPGEPAAWIPGTEISLVEFFSGGVNGKPAQAN